MLALFVLVACAPTLCVLALHLLIDPLWYGSGNRLFEQNFPYNERFSKAILFHRDPTRYDCVILGSSRTTLLDASEIEGHSCFNFSVSNGNVGEYEEFVRYAGSKTDLRLVVLGVDAFNFSDHGLGGALPEFVRSGTDPPNFFESYLSLDVLSFSLSALVSREHRTRYYDADFVCNVMSGQGPFEPALKIDPSHDFGGLAASPTNTVGPFFPSRAHGLVDRIRSEHPSIRLVGYVPPLSAHFLAHVQSAGNLDGYLESIWNASRGFDAFFDFSFPSELTTDVRNTYDGSHFFRSVNDRVAEVLSESRVRGEPGIALELHSMTERDYFDAFKTALDAFIERTYAESLRSGAA